MDRDDTEDLSNTILKTPRPQASSTVTKGSSDCRGKINDARNESLGILPIEYTEGNITGKEFNNSPSLIMSEGSFKLNETLLESRRKAQKTMKTSSVREDSFDCDSAFNDKSDKCWLESTVNETDLDKHRTKYFESMNNLTLEIKHNTTQNLSDIFEKHLVTDVSSQIDSGMFMPAELFVDKFLVGNVLKSSNHDFDVTQNEKTSLSQMSYGEFFRKKSDNDSSLLNKTSPEKDSPVCLASFRHSNEKSKTIGSEENCLDTLSVSQIKNMISNENSTLVNMFFCESGKNGGIHNGKASVSCFKNFVKPKVQFSKSVSNLSESEKENTANSINISTSVIQSSTSMESLYRASSALQCNKTELVWSCVKVGKVKSQCITFRNRNSYKTRFQICLTNPNYKIFTPDRDFTSTFIEVFYPNESKQYTVKFIPTKEGPCLGKMTFTPIVKGDLQPSQMQLLNLYAYGGYSNIDTRDVIKDTSGKYLLTFGKLTETLQPIKFLIKNSGTIPGFAAFSFTPKKLYMFSNLKIIPESVLVRPSESTIISVYYVASKQDFKHINAWFGSGEDVFQLGTITMVTGSEITRCRLKNHCKKVEQMHLQVEPIIKQVTGILKDKNDADCTHFNESFQATKELQKELQQREFVVTIQSDPDKTLTPNQTMDETSKYFTMINNMNLKSNYSSFV